MIQMTISKFSDDWWRIGNHVRGIFNLDELEEYRLAKAYNGTYRRAYPDRYLDSLLKIAAAFERSGCEVAIEEVDDGP